MHSRKQSHAFIELPVTPVLAECAQNWQKKRWMLGDLGWAVVLAELTGAMWVYQMTAVNGPV